MWLAVPILILMIGVTGFVLTTRLQRRDREADARRVARVESVRAQGALADARAFVAGLGNVLNSEPGRSEQRFARLAVGAAGTVGLIDAMWVQSVPAGARGAYELRLGAPITHLSRTHRFTRAPPAAVYLPATFTTRTRDELRQGVDVSAWAGLRRAIENRANVFAVSASAPSVLGDQPGFYLLQAADYGGGAQRHGFLAVFVPQGWLTRVLDEDPRRIALFLGARRLEGGLSGRRSASESFELLGQPWRIDVAMAPRSAWQSAYPWIALSWPLVLALLVGVTGRGILRRRRAEAEFERMFHVSHDLLCIAGFDGRFRRVNPAFEQALRYPLAELLASPMLRFVHPDDRSRTEEAIARLATGEEMIDFEIRAVRADGVTRWLEWSARPIPGEGVFYAAARDITERKQMADQQAALRRVATLVARGESAGRIIGSTVSELQAVVAADATALMRYDTDGSALIVASSGDGPFAVDTRLPADGDNVAAQVRRTAKAVRMDDYAAASGWVAERLLARGLRSGAGAPIIVQDQLWGVMVTTWSTSPPPPGAEAGVAQFTELVAVAIANAEGRTQLAASRARVVATADETRRRIERDLHDATQQRLVSLGLEMRAAEEALPQEFGELRARLAATGDGLNAVLNEVQEISRGIHPAILTTGGLGPALRTLVRRSPVPVQLDFPTDARRLSQPVEVAAYYVVSEALTNATKHAAASEVRVEVVANHASVDLTIRDDGVGGADPGGGSGLVGLRDRVEALGGTITVASPRGAGTSISVTIPNGGE
jgi:PAS domain S-box-containing protein